MGHGDRLSGGHDGETRPGGALGMIGLVAARVEDGHHAVAREVLDDPAPGIDGRDDRSPVLVQHPDHLGR